jgi:hypothetical protein
VIFKLIHQFNSIKIILNDNLMSIRFIEKEISNKKLKDQTQNIFANYPLFNIYDFEPTIRVWEPEEKETHQIKENSLNEINEKKLEDSKVYI